MVTLVSTIADVRARVAAAKQSGRIVGFVPTMGALHAGHARLIEQCRAETDFVVVSIFVNPTQFALNEDLRAIPGHSPPIWNSAKRAEPTSCSLPPSRRCILVAALRKRSSMCPRSRRVLKVRVAPDHFRGVATVVLKLFAITQPELAFFGAKDYQQQIVIRRMVDDLRLPVTIRTVATVREPDGLAHEQPEPLPQPRGTRRGDGAVSRIDSGAPPRSPAACERSGGFDKSSSKR